MSTSRLCCIRKTETSKSETQNRSNCMFRLIDFHSILRTYRLWFDLIVCVCVCAYGRAGKVVADRIVWFDLVAFHNFSRFDFSIFH